VTNYSCFLGLSKRLLQVPDVVPEKPEVKKMSTGEFVSRE
jgi:hypothetical protein